MTLRVSRRIIFAVPVLAATGTVGGLAKATEGDFSAFLAGVRRDALARGIRASTVDAAFRNVQFLPRVVELDRKQPERTMTFTQYIAKVVTPAAQGGCPPSAGRESSRYSTRFRGVTMSSPASS